MVVSKCSNSYEDESLFLQNTAKRNKILVLNVIKRDFHGCCMWIWPLNSQDSFFCVAEWVLFYFTAQSQPYSSARKYSLTSAVAWQSTSTHVNCFLFSLEWDQINLIAAQTKVLVFCEGLIKIIIISELCCVAFSGQTEWVRGKWSEVAWGHVLCSRCCHLIYSSKLPKWYNIFIYSYN